MSKIWEQIATPYLSQQSTRSFVGAALILTHEIRSLQHNGVPVFEVIDDGEEEHVAHALIFFRSEHINDSTLNKRARRKDLVDMLNRHRLSDTELKKLFS